MAQTTDYSAGDRVIYSFTPGSRVGRTPRMEIVCEIVDPEPFADELDRGRKRVRVRCIDDRDPMNGNEFIPFLDRLRPER